VTLTHQGVTAPGAAAASGRPVRRHRRSSGTTVVLTVIAVVVGTAFVLPAVWILVGSFRPNLEILTTMSPLSWHTIIPSELTLENYRRLLFDSGFSRALVNSFVVCLVSVLAGLLMSAMAAYALSVIRFPGRNVIFAVIVISFMIPFEAIAIPLAQQFFQFAAPAPMVLQSLVVGAVGAIAIEVIYRLQPDMRQEPEEPKTLVTSVAAVG
jgi:ABC-type glycerol-3-phosphate transport system permease component